MAKKDKAAPEAVEISAVGRELMQKLASENAAAIAPPEAPKSDVPLMAPVTGSVTPPAVSTQATGPAAIPLGGSGLPCWAKVPEQPKVPPQPVSAVIQQAMTPAPPPQTEMPDTVVFERPRVQNAKNRVLCLECCWFEMASFEALVPCAEPYGTCRHANNPRPNVRWPHTRTCGLGQRELGKTFNG